MKKNKIFVNKINKKIGNNQTYTDVIEKNNVKEENQIVQDNANLSVEEKINRLFKRNGYIFNVDVKIITPYKEYHTKIASKVHNHLITLDNDIINISDIKDIIIQN